MMQVSFVLTTVLDNDIAENDFNLQSQHYVHFQTNTLENDINTLTSNAVDKIAPLFFIYNDGFGIQSPMEVNMLLIKKIQMDSNLMLTRVAYIYCKHIPHDTLYHKIVFFSLYTNWILPLNTMTLEMNFQILCSYNIYA